MPLPLSDQIMVFSKDTGNSEAGTDLGAVFPPFTTAERDSIAGPKEGAILYNSTEEVFNGFIGGSWETLLTVPTGTDIILTSDNVGQVLISDNTGNVLIGG